jgi:hypothetical protein
MNFKTMMKYRLFISMRRGFYGGADTLSLRLAVSFVMIVLTGAILRAEPQESPPPPLEKILESAKTEEAAETKEPPAPEVPEKKLSIEWTSIENAKGYIVQIQDENQNTILEQHVSETKINFHLDPGKYRQRVGVVNKFGKISSYTEWNDFIVLKPTGPLIREIRPQIVREEGPTLISVFGSNFKPGVEVEIVHAEKKSSETLKPEYTGEGLIQFRLDPMTHLNGQYTLRISNPDGRETEKVNILSIQSPDLQKDKRILAEARKSQRDGEGFRWSNLIIGYPRIENGYTLTGTAQITIFSGFVAGSVVESAIANNIATLTENSFVHKIYSDLLFHQFATNSFTNQELLRSLGIKEWQLTKTNKDKYSWHRRNATNFAAAAGAVYLLHLADAFGFIDISLDFGDLKEAVLEGPANIYQSDTTSLKLTYRY